MKYVPFLKLKQGELGAIKFLAPEICSDVKPYHLFLNDNNENRVGEYLDSLLNPLSKAYASKDMSFFADFTGFTDYQIIHVCELLRERDFDFTYVINNLNIDLETATYLKEANLYGNGLALKIDATAELNMAEMNSRIKKIMSFFTIAPNQIDMILDFGYIPMENLGLYINMFETLQKGLDSFLEFRNVIILAGSFPRDMNGIAVNTIHYLPMLELRLFNQLKKMSNRELVYGDFGNIHPVINTEPVTFQGSCSIKYTVSSQFLIFRGTIPGRVPEGTGQYVQKCKLLVASNEYCGEDFSYGDREIALYANDLKKGNGSSTTWITNTLNHHIAKIISDLD